MRPVISRDYCFKLSFRQILDIILTRSIVIKQIVETERMTVEGLNWEYPVVVKLCVYNDMIKQTVTITGSKNNDDSY